jgi:hypothetical protein
MASTSITAPVFELEELPNDLTLIERIEARLKQVTDAYLIAEAANNDSSRMYMCMMRLLCIFERIKIVEKPSSSSNSMVKPMIVQLLR